MVLICFYFSWSNSDWTFCYKFRVILKNLLFILAQFYRNKLVKGNYRNFFIRETKFFSLWCCMLGISFHCLLYIRKLSNLIIDWHVVSVYFSNFKIILINKNNNEKRIFRAFCLYFIFVFICSKRIPPESKFVCGIYFWVLLVFRICWSRHKNNLFTEVAQSSYFNRKIFFVFFL